VSQQRLLHQRYKAQTLIGGWQAVGERGTWSAAAVVARAHCRRPATSIDRLHRQIFAADTNSTVNCAVTSDLVQNEVLYFVKIQPAMPHTIWPEADFTS